MDEVLRELTAAELREWQAYYALEPFGDEWPRTALLACLIANANRDTEVRPEPFEVADFMPNAQELLPGSFVAEDEADMPEIVEDEPPWMGWKRLFQEMAESSN